MTTTAPGSSVPPVAVTMDHGLAQTRWTLVLRSKSRSTEGRAALSELCAIYYPVVFRFLAATGRTLDEAQELTHGFFAHLLARGGLANPNPAQGRFRNYLFAAVKYFVRDQHALETRQKRGGGDPHESIDCAADQTPALQVADQSTTSDDAIFDREWAVAL